METLGGERDRHRPRFDRGSSVCLRRVADLAKSP
jgi:hypothetical protein